MCPPNGHATLVPEGRARQVCWNPFGPGPIHSSTGEDERVTTRRKTCEYVSVAASLQQMIRDREAVSDPVIVVPEPLDGACGRPAEGFVADREGHERAYCSNHLREMQPYWALARQP